MEKLSKRLELRRFFSKQKNLDTIKKVKFIAKGGHGRVSLYSGPKNKNIIIKKVYIEAKDVKYINKLTSKVALRRNVFIEYYVLDLVNVLVTKSVSPHFILNYQKFVQKRIDTGVACEEKYPYKMLLYSEYIYDSLTIGDFASKSHASIEVLYNLLFQIMYSLYALRKYYNLYHLDLHAKNILITNVTPGGYWKYTTHKNTHYYVPNLGFLAIIIDFDQAWIPGVLSGDFITYHESYDPETIDDTFDIQFLLDSLIERDISSSKNNLFKQIQKQISSSTQSFSSFIPNIFSEMYFDAPRGKPLGSFSLLKKIEFT